MKKSIISFLCCVIVSLLCFISCTDDPPYYPPTWECSYQGSLCFSDNSIKYYYCWIWYDSGGYHEKYYIEGIEDDYWWNYWIMEEYYCN